jgi:hypothetical protein
MESMVRIFISKLEEELRLTVICSGGIYWTGSGTCVSGTTCVYNNAYYSQVFPTLDIYSLQNMTNDLRVLTALGRPLGNYCCIYVPLCI